MAKMKNYAAPAGRGGKNESKGPMVARDMYKHVNAVAAYGICAKCKTRFRISPQARRVYVLCAPCFRGELGQDPGASVLLAVMEVIDQKQITIKTELAAKKSSMLREEFLRGQLFAFVDIRERIFKSSAPLRIFYIKYYTKIMFGGKDGKTADPMVETEVTQGSVQENP